MGEPRILLFVDLTKPIKNILVNIEESRSQLKDNSSEIIDKSIFSYIFSMFETMLSEMLTMFLDAFPEKIDKQEFKVNKSDIEFINTILFKRNKIEQYVKDLSYKNSKEYLDAFFDILSIDPINEEDTNKLIEVKETRNLLLHNNLKVNNTYSAKAGPCRREADHSGFLPLDKKYVLDSFDLIEKQVNYIKQETTEKYSKYDKFHVLREIWNFIFDSPLLKFEDFWGDSKTGIILKKEKKELKSKIEDCFSSSEVIFLFLWLTHFNSYLCDEIFKPRFINTFLLDGDHRRKYLYLNNIILNYPDLFKTP